MSSLNSPLKRPKQFVGNRGLQLVVSSILIFMDHSFKVFLFEQYTAPEFLTVQLEHSVNPVKCTQRLSLNLGPERPGKRE
jgi:hypothetical protein